MKNRTVVSLFDGIGGFPLAFERAGAKTVATVEIDKAAAAISKRHFPDATQFDDVTKVCGDDLRSVGFVPERGIITAGWPCQDLSIAGRRAGLDGARSGLWWEVVRILDETRPRWFLGENVPGLLSSNGGEDLGAVLGSLGDLGYGFAYRVLDAQFFGVPQRRRRFFLVGHLGEPWTAPAEVLFELEGGIGDSAQGGQAGQGITGSASDGARGFEPVCATGHTHTHTLTASAAKLASEDGTGRGVPIVTDLDTHTHTHTQRSRPCRPGRVDGGSTPKQQRAGISSWAVAALTANGVGTCGADDNQAQAGHLIAQPAEHRGGARGFHMTQDPISSEELVPAIGANSMGNGVGNGVMVQPLAIRGRDGGAELEAGEPGAPANALRSAGGGGGGSLHPLVAISQDNTTQCVAENQRGEVREGNTVGALSSGGGKPGQGYAAVREGTIVRRLTPLECERLQGFPDSWTDNGQADSARYRQLGNSVAVPCVQWIAERLLMVDGQLRRDT